jgi:TM2 domain-containing membrane protein YozV
MVERGELEAGVRAIRRWQVTLDRLRHSLVFMALFFGPGSPSAPAMGWADAPCRVTLEDRMPQTVPNVSDDFPFSAPDSVGRENGRWVCAALAVFLGPFGAHRLYLGTTAKVPVVYGITFGGFYLLVLIDLGHILFSKDLSPFEHNDRVFMWARPKSATTPP